ncbi:neprilysin-like isoform X3 [Pimephales promelas]|uniref:neprilysin-like isoform X3 n=1 Tax=Pimephales promelas TaxID=90988 RepID=UPI001955B4CB|nr:neprilysin-like isoform X3 [Pimephales promelas]
MFERLVMPIYIIDRKFPETPGDFLQAAPEGQQTMADNNTQKKKPSWMSLKIGLLTIVSLLLVIIVALILLFVTQSGKHGVCITADCTQSEVLEREESGSSSSLTKANVLYKSCTNESLIEQRGGTPLLTMLPDVFEWPIATDDWDTTYGMNWIAEHAIAKLNEKYGKQVLISLFIGTDDRDSTAHILHFDQPSLGLASRDYYVCTGPYEEACVTYENFMTDLAKLIRTDRGLKVNDTNIKQEVARVMMMEKEIANATDTPEDRNDPVLLYNKVPLETLNNNFTLDFDSRVFNWTLFTNKIMDTVGVPITDSEEVIVYAPNYFKRLNPVLAKYTKRDIQNYLVWRFVMNLVVGLSRQYRETRKAFRKAIYGTTSEVAVWRQCAIYVNNNMENAVGRLYVEQAFAGDSKDMVSCVCMQCISV